MTRKEFQEMKKTALDKWRDGKNQTVDSFEEWWYSTGCESCSFCLAFNANNDDCPNCPLKDGNGCADEWDNINSTIDHDRFDIFIKDTKALYSRIYHIKYEDIKK